MAALRRGEIGDDDFLINSEIMCLDIAISTVSTYIGQKVIPIPILGGLIGNIVGEALNSICQKYADEQERRIISQFIAGIEAFQSELDDDYTRYYTEIQKHIHEFYDLCAFAFDPDVNIAFAGSIRLARKARVPEESILKTIVDIDDYFTG